MALLIYAVINIKHRLLFENQKFIVFLPLNITVKKKLKFYTILEKHASKNLKKSILFEIMSV